MELGIEIRADILKTAMQEDRNEIRLIKDRIYASCSALTLAAFAVAAFLLGRPESAGNHRLLYFLALVDLSVITLIWAVFKRLQADLLNARKCLQARERMIRNLKEIDGHDWNPFPNASKEKVTIKETSLYLEPTIATFALLLMLVFIGHGLIH